MNIIIVGGNFSDSISEIRKSGFIEKFSNEIKKLIGFNSHIEVHNGGSYLYLEEVFEKLDNADVIFWLPNVPNNYKKIVKIKNRYPHKLVIFGKNCYSKIYDYPDLVQKALELKANLLMAFYKSRDEKIVTEVIDPLGNSYITTSYIDKLTKSILERIVFLSDTKRVKSVKAEFVYPENREIAGMNVPEDFIKIVRHYGEIFHEKMGIETKRFLGNSSFRCLHGFPSFRFMDDFIFVSKRNVDKETICRNDFILACPGKDNIYYDNLTDSEFPKPSIDSPIQIQLYDLFPHINFMLHSHCYIESAPFTKKIFPCGDLREVEEIKKCWNSNIPAINLLGHGSLFFAESLPEMLNIKYYARPIPEILGEK